jgi:hypothetical protein
MRKTAGNVLLMVVVLIAGFGCASVPKSAKGPVFAPVSVPENQAVVYFFRPQRTAMSATTIFMSIPTEADNCYSMVNNGYYTHVADPGELKVFSAALRNKKDYAIDLKPGESRFVQIGFGKWGPVPEYEEIPADRALVMLAGNRLITTCK